MMEAKGVELPVANGVLNIEKGILRPYEEEDKFPYRLDVQWKGLEEKTDTIEKFFTNKSFEIQKALADCLLGNRDKKALVIITEDDRVKSTLKFLLSALLELYCVDLKGQIF